MCLLGPHASLSLTSQVELYKYGHLRSKVILGFLVQDPTFWKRSFAFETFLYYFVTRLPTLYNIFLLKLRALQGSPFDVILDKGFFNLKSKPMFTINQIYSIVVVMCHCNLFSGKSLNNCTFKSSKFIVYSCCASESFAKMYPFGKLVK